MDDVLAKLTMGGLLHDIGKVIHRAGVIDGRSHSKSGADYIKSMSSDKEIEQCIRFHHKSELWSANIDEDSLAYIVYLADNIASGADRRENEIEGDNEGQRFNKRLPLSPVFNLLNKSNGSSSLKAQVLNDRINMPINDAKNSIEADFYNKIHQNIGAGLSSINFNGDYVNSLLELLEGHLSFIPSSTLTREVADISLFDHSKITAAIACCMYEYLRENGISNYKEELLVNEKDFMDKKAFLMFSCDFSGIQKFIYNVISKGALKSLRSRSFFLEIFLENFIDELLMEVGLSRTNIIYAGGGHAYILLANTASTKEKIEKINKIISEWLINNYGITLYLATAYYECSANALCNKPASKTPYKRIFEGLSRSLSKTKMSRYEANDIHNLNNLQSGGGERECKICGTTANLMKDDICSLCNNFKSLSSKILEKDIMLVKKRCDGDNGDLILPSIDGENIICFEDEDKAKKLLKEGNIKRVYSKNTAYTGLKYSSKIYIGDYIALDEDKKPILEMGGLSALSTGIDRIGVLRADVDNLGLAFTSGFERDSDDIEKKNKYVTLSRTATFSRQMSMFFKYYINSIFAGKVYDSGFALTKDKHKVKSVAIVYSGGDDAFIVGAWDQVLEAGIDLHNALNEFSCGTLSISAGFSIFDDKYPIYKAASDTGMLEDAAKHYKPEKNAICLFEETGHTYKWNEFTDIVVGEKLAQLKAFFDMGDNDRGKAFLYRLLELLREADNKLNIARYAYMLARLEPSEKSEQYANYKAFSANMYKWILNKADRDQLTTAIYLYIYLIRDKN